MRAAISEVAEEIHRQVKRRTAAQPPQGRDADDPAPGERRGARAGRGLSFAPRRFAAPAAP